jgi:hypothetical protein
VLGSSRLGSGHFGGPRPDEREQPELERALVELDLAADHRRAQLVEEGLQGDALAVELELVAEVEHAQVAAHLALGGEQRGVAARARDEADDVVGHLAGEELLGFGARERELAPLGSVHERATRGGGLVGARVDGGDHS